ncbi:40S ribosomal protein S8-A [Thelohanellus kitauei]|uniref:40S ribosomal protein S8-A n=1 Tax=Thelohanellus kitauei TaxID=669202 RepID=A0A0C2J6C4_THEKT|nr:40S ribosomal protein S8-A [Thelohanellus kitauei]
MSQSLMFFQKYLNFFARQYCAKPILPKPPSLFRMGRPNTCMVLRTKGGNKRLMMLYCSTAYCFWGSQNLVETSRILSVDMIPENYEFVTREYLVKGAILKLDSKPFLAWLESPDFVPGVDENLQSQLEKGYIYAKICVCPFNEGYMLTRMLEGDELKNHQKLSKKQKWAGKKLIPKTLVQIRGSIF